MKLTEFLPARIGEDETAARERAADAMTGWRWKHYPKDAYDEVQALTLAHSRRVLTECKAKRRIVSLFTPTLADALTAEAGEWDETAFRGDQALRALALPYADHPDYREEWRP